MNWRRTGALQKQPNDGVEYNGHIDDRGVCAVGESEQEANAKKETLDVQHSLQLSTVDFMGSRLPNINGWLVSTLSTSLQSGRRFFLKDKSQTTELVIPSGYVGYVAPQTNKVGVHEC